MAGEHNKIEIIRGGIPWFSVGWGGGDRSQKIEKISSGGEGKYLQKNNFSSLFRFICFRMGWGGGQMGQTNRIIYLRIISAPDNMRICVKYACKNKKTD